jgi:hypothetical protein
MSKTYEYIKDLVVNEDDPKLQEAKDSVEVSELLCNDPWLLRQLHYGVAGAMERQMDYLFNDLIPSVESKIARLNGQTVSREIVQPSWAGSTNSEEPHINDEAPDQAIDNSQTFLESLENRVRTAAIIFVMHMKAHDEVSITLDQLSYAQIKHRAAQKREAATKAA